MKQLCIVIIFLICSKHFGQISDFKHVNFEKADNVAKKYKGASLKNLPVLAYQLTSELNTDVEKFRAIYLWICSNIANDYSNHVQNLNKRRKFKNDSLALFNWNDKFKEKALKKLIKHKKTICTGYAYLLQELASLGGLNCKMIHGYGRTVESNIGEWSIPNHSWNAVQLNGKWYLSDPTWASGYFDIDEGHFVRAYNNGYFLSDPTLFVKSHFPLESKWLLGKLNFTEDDFLNGPLVYGSTFKHHVIPLQPLKMQMEIVKNDVIAFKFQVPDTIKKEDISLLISGSSDKVLTDIFRLKGNVLEFEYLFKRRGLFDCHLKVGEDVVATHVVKVLKQKTID